MVVGGERWGRLLDKWRFINPIIELKLRLWSRVESDYSRGGYTARDQGYINLSSGAYLSSEPKTHDIHDMRWPTSRTNRLQSLHDKGVLRCMLAHCKRDTGSHDGLDVWLNDWNLGSLFGWQPTLLR